MVVRKRKKVVKMRGSKTHGYGSKKKHRGKGSKGGKGYAGSHKHKWTYIVKYEPDHFGKHGFTSLKKVKMRRRIKIINVGELEKIATGKEIDLDAMGYTKLLGKGEVTKPFVVKISNFSAKAKEKIEAAGGKILGSGES